MHSLEMTIRDILAENFKKLREATPSLNSPKDLIKIEAASNGTIGRIATRQTGVSIDKLEPLARAYGLEVWQMLVPTLHAEKGPLGKPIVSGLPEWPFEMVDQDSYMALDQSTKIAVQIGMRSIIKEEAELERLRKRNGTSS